MIETLDSLSELLHQWYGEPQGTLSLDTVENLCGYAPPLVTAWSLFGGLLSKSEEWFNDGTPTPLCCQDGLAPVTRVRIYSDRLDLAFENQGNWSFCYKRKSKSADPRVFSNWLYTEVGYDPGFIQIGAKLSDFLITICLQETIMFGWDSELSKALENPDPDNLFGKKIWEGRYYNAIGFGNDYEMPSHIIHSDAELTKLVLYNRTSAESLSRKPYAATQSVAQNRYRKGVYSNLNT